MVLHFTCNSKSLEQTSKIIHVILVPSLSVHLQFQVVKQKLVIQLRKERK